MSRFTVLILANGLFIIGSLVLLWALKRWIERRNYHK